MKHKLKLSLIALLLSLCVKAHSQVNLQEGSFHVTAKDFGLIERSYSSRSLHEGYFGFGWCSILEARRDKICDLNQNPFSELKMKFRADGKIGSWGKRGHEILLVYKEDRPLEIKTQNLTFRIEYEGPRIVRISRSPWHRIDYTYQNKNLIRFSGLNPAELQYDSLHNLIALVSSKTALKIKYLELQDTVSEIRGLSKCYETYNFTPEDFFGLKFKAEVFEICPEKKSLKVRIDFQFNKQSSGNLKLVSAKVWDQNKIAQFKLNAGGPE